MADASSPFDAGLKCDGDNVSPSPVHNLQYEKGLVTTKEWIEQNITKDLLGRMKRYVIGFFPIFSWIYRYNLTWAIGGIFWEILRALG